MICGREIKEADGLAVAGLAVSGAGFLEAGRELVELYVRDNGVFNKIMRQAPWVTVDMLMTLLRIGRKEIHPKVLLYSGRKIFDRMIALPYDRQEKLVNDPMAMGDFMQGEPTKTGGKRSDGFVRVRQKEVALTPEAAKAFVLGRKPVEPVVPPVIAKEHGAYMVVIKPGKNPQFFKRTGTPYNAQRVRLEQDPDDPGALIANLELYEMTR